MTAAEPSNLRDGLTASQRRVLRALTPGFVVSERVVGRDRALYGALVALAQDWVTRHPLVDGEGNLGSIDADPPADSRFTEVRLVPVAGELARFPHLLVNGAPGIPPHNLREVVGAALAHLDDPDSDPLEHIAGPDFPTGGIVTGGSQLRAAYETGRGEFEVRARAHVEDGWGGPQIVVTELPFLVDKGGDDGLIARIADGVAARALAEVRDLRDESDRHGVRLVVEIARGADPAELLDRLFAHTSMRSVFAVRMVAVVDGAPRRLTLRDIIRRWIDLRLRDTSPWTVRAELLAVAERFGDERRTELVP